MFETDKPLDEMSLEELETLRLTWIKALEPIMVSVHDIVSKHGKNRRELSRIMRSVNSMGFSLEITSTEKRYSEDYETYKNHDLVQVAYQGEIVLSMIGAFLETGEYQELHLRPWHFARPHSAIVDWTPRLQEIIDSYDQAERRKKERETEEERQVLLKLLQTGKV